MQTPIDSLELLPELNDKLISFLRQLPPDGWMRQTVARQWVVKDVAAHLLDGNLRRIALHRDGWNAPPDRGINSWQDLVDYLNQLNADWVKASRRLSPQILIELLESTNTTVYGLFSDLDPNAQSAFPVSWAGEDVSRNWFDIAREYSERFLHQQQIREANADDSLLNSKLYHHCLHIFLHAWPHACRDLDAAEGSLLKATITGRGGGEWFLYRENGGWRLANDVHENILAETIVDGSVAWKLFSKSVRRSDVPGGYEIKGDVDAGSRLLDMVSVMA